MQKVLSFVLLIISIMSFGVFLASCGGGGGSSGGDGDTTGIWDSSTWDNNDTWAD